MANDSLDPVIGKGPPGWKTRCNILHQHCYVSMKNGILYIEIPESRPTSVYISVSSSSSAASTTNFGSGSATANALLKPPMSSHDKIEMDMMPV